MANKFFSLKCRNEKNPVAVQKRERRLRGEKKKEERQNENLKPLCVSQLTQVKLEHTIKEKKRKKRTNEQTKEGEGPSSRVHCWERERD